MTNENTDRSELGKLLKKRKLSIDNADKEIFPLVDHFIAKEKTQESEIDCETLLETILDTESEVTELNYRIKDLILDDNKLSEYLKNSTVRNDWVKLQKIVLRKFIGDPLDWKSFNETFEAAVHRSDSISSIEKFTYLKTYLDKSALQAIEGFPLKNENYTAAWELLDQR